MGAPAQLFAILSGHFILVRRSLNQRYFMKTSVEERIRSGMLYERERKGPPEDFPALPDIPAGRYVDPQFVTLETGYLWKKSWLFAVHADELPEPGSYRLWRKTGAPILIVRGKDDQIRAFYNTCRHRGGPLVKDAQGTVRGLVCGYHGWTYDLEGNLKNLRDRRDFVDLDMSCRSLIPVRCESLGRLVFISEDPDAPPLREYLGPIPSHFDEFQPDQLRLVNHQSWEINCNVKVLLDAFLEVYHLKSIHQSTVDRFLDHRGTTIMLWDKGHSLMVTPNRRPDWQDPGSRGLPEIPTVSELPRNNNFSYNIFPNIVTPVDKAGFPFITFWPSTINTMTLDVHWFGPDQGDELDSVWETRLANFDRILEEDTQFAPQIQASVESPGFHGIPLNYQERRIYHWHEELDRRIGRDNVPEHLRIVPRLAACIEDG